MFPCRCYAFSLLALVYHKMGILVYIAIASIQLARDGEASPRCASLTCWWKLSCFHFPNTKYYALANACYNIPIQEQNFVVHLLVTVTFGNANLFCYAFHDHRNDDRIDSILSGSEGVDRTWKNGGVRALEGWFVPFLYKISYSIPFAYCMWRGFPLCWSWYRFFSYACATANLRLNPKPKTKRRILYSYLSFRWLSTWWTHRQTIVSTSVVFFQNSGRFVSNARRCDYIGSMVASAYCTMNLWRGGLTEVAVVLCRTSRVQS